MRGSVMVSNKMTKLLKVILIYALAVCILLPRNGCFADNGHDLIEQDIYTNGTCGSDELNHSILVECDIASSCPNSADSGEDAGKAAIRPKNSAEVLHIQSSHSGKRLVQAAIEPLNYIVDDHMKMFDINTTLTIGTKLVSANQIGAREILGLGGTLELKRLVLAIEDDSFERVFGPIFAIMSGISNLNLLRLTAEYNFIREHDLGKIFQELDKQVARSRSLEPNQAKLKIVLDLMKLPAPDNRDLLALGVILTNLRENFEKIEIWALTINEEDMRGADDIMKLHVPCHLFGNVLLERAPDFVDWLKADGARLNVKGLLVMSQHSTAYNTLKYLVEDKELIILTVGRMNPATKYFGDWRNAQEYAVEILNHLKYGSHGFIENVSMIELASPEPMASYSDASIYSLATSHNRLFKSPMFYATCHFSRYLSASRPIEYKLYTQPNMFSAHYSAFMTSDEQYVVSIVLNGNEHILPFSWVIDDKVIAHAGLEPKSFNTFVTKIK